MSRHGERIPELVEVESAKRNDRPQLGAVMAFAKKGKATLPRIRSIAARILSVEVCAAAGSCWIICTA